MKDEKPDKDGNLSLSDFMRQEAENTYRMFREDALKVKAAMDVRKKQIEQLQAEQVSDLRKQIKLDGALSAMQHIVTKYKEAWAKERDQKRAKRGKRKTNG
ncbi:hypothetical protein LCGC14_2374750 [marine sediment metagenome]|uniref:Uncharacterized protein n=1 Tax=marine sediment metagenome TaxID=412755 RepID=A0A0F9EF43_9ZZZZ